MFVHPAEGGPGIELLRRRGCRQPEEEVEKGEEKKFELKEIHPNTVLQVKSSMKLQNVFRRVSQVSRGASDTVDGEDKEKKVK